MANITPVQVTSDGTAVLTLTAAAGGGDTIINATTSTVFVVNNGSGVSITVTLAGVTACNQGVVHNPQYTVAAGKQVPIPIPSQCLSASNTVGVTYSAVTTVTVAAYKN